jgi:UDP-N-acetylglucosamine 2-epimerase (non-hydrolysing)
MMKKLKVLTVVGTRPEIIRLSCVLKKLDTSPAIEHVLIHTGQNYDYELNEVFFEDLGLRKPDFFLNAAGANATETAGQILIKIDPVLEAVQPNAFLVLGDTNSCLCAIAAKKRHIPIFHMEAGNRCFDQRVPEESNRKIVDHISDINLTYSDIAREYLLREGLPPDRIIKTGSPMYEVLHHYMEKIEKSKILEGLDLVLKFEGSKVLKCGNTDNLKGTQNQAVKPYFVVSAHREENISSERNFANLVHVLNLIAEKYKYPIIVSTHPRTRKMIEKKQVVFDPLVRLMKPMGLSDYLSLQMNAKAVLSDSGTISEESSILNFPALNVREAHERPEAMEEASVMMVGLNPERIMQGLAQLETQARGKRDGGSSKVLKFERASLGATPSKGSSLVEEEGRGRNEEAHLRLVRDYSMPNVSDKVVRIILSYTDYVNRVVWQK